MLGPGSGLLCFLSPAAELGEEAVTLTSVRACLHTHALARPGWGPVGKGRTEVLLVCTLVPVPAPSSPPSCFTKPCVSARDDERAALGDVPSWMKLTCAMRQADGQGDPPRATRWSAPTAAHADHDVLCGSAPPHSISDDDDHHLYQGQIRLLRNQNACSAVRSALYIHHPQAQAKTPKHTFEQGW